jgi:hypothetical protein
VVFVPFVIFVNSACAVQQTYGGFMPVDIRIPIGLMFALMGSLLAGYGAFGDHTIYARSLGLNINLIWGGVLLVCGAFFVVMGTRPGRA